MGQAVSGGWGTCEKLRRSLHRHDKWSMNGMAKLPRAALGLAWGIRYMYLCRKLKVTSPQIHEQCRAEFCNMKQ